MAEEEYEFSDDGEGDADGLLELCQSILTNSKQAYKDANGSDPDEGMLQMLFLADFLKGIQEQLGDLTEATKTLAQQVARNGLRKPRGRDT